MATEKSGHSNYLLLNMQKLQSCTLKKTEESRFFCPKAHAEIFLVIHIYNTVEIGYNYKTYYEIIECFLFCSKECITITVFYNVKWLKKKKKLEYNSDCLLKKYIYFVNV